MNFFNKILNRLCIMATKQSPEIKKYKQKLTAGVNESGVIRQGHTVLFPSYKKYFFCDKKSGEGWFFRFKPIKDDGKYPVVIYHHGNGLNRAGKNDIQMSEFSWLKRNLNKQKCHQVALHNDCVGEYNTDDHSRALDGIIDYIEKTYKNVDFSRIYLTGTSHGGYACVYEILRKPEKYAAAVIAMGYTYNELFKLPDEFKTNEFMRNLTESDYKTLAGKPFFLAWAKDDNHYITDSNELLSENLKANEGNVKVKIYETGGHTIASDFFKHSEWTKWLFEISN